MWNYDTRSNICVIGVLEGEEKEGKAKNLLKEIKSPNLLNLSKDMHLQTQEAEKIPNRIYPKKSSPRHIIVKLLKPKTKKKS